MKCDNPLFVEERDVLLGLCCYTLERKFGVIFSIRTAVPEKYCTSFMRIAGIIAEIERQYAAGVQIICRRVQARRLIGAEFQICCCNSVIRSRADMNHVLLNSTTRLYWPGNGPVQSYADAVVFPAEISAIGLQRSCALAVEIELRKIAACSLKRQT